MAGDREPVDGTHGGCGDRCASSGRRREWRGAWRRAWRDVAGMAGRDGASGKHGWVRRGMTTPAAGTAGCGRHGGRATAVCESEDGERRRIGKESSQLSWDAEEESDATTLAHLLERNFSALSLFCLFKMIYKNCWSCSELAAGEVSSGSGGERGGVAELVQLEVLLYVLHELHCAPSKTP